MSAIKDTIFDRILDLTEDRIKPKFRAKFLSGWLILNCKDKFTADWAKGIAGNITPWKTASLKAVDEDDIPREQILLNHFPVNPSFGNEKILDAIGTQNADFLISEWRVVKRENKGNLAFLTFAVDHKSMVYLRRQQFKVDFRFGEVVRRTSRGYKIFLTSRPTPSP